MNNRIEIILEVQSQRFYLDTQGIDAIPLTLNIQNIKDISTSNGSFSKSIVVPETINNRTVFNNISDLNAGSSFNPNLRNRVYILVDTQLVVEGYFQLTSIQLDFNNHNNQLTLLVTADNNDLYTKLGETYIEKIDLSVYDHVWTDNNITSSWTKDYTNGYYYPLIDYGYSWDITNINGSHIVCVGATISGIVNTYQMFPGVYCRTIFDKIFSDAGFSWNSNSLLTETPFNNLIIPFNNNNIDISLTFSNSNIFRVGLTASQQLTNQHSYTLDTGYLPFQQPQGYSSFGYASTASVNFNDETSPNGDPNNLWSTSLYEYTNTSLYPIRQRFGMSMNITQLLYYAVLEPPTLQLVSSFIQPDLSNNIQTCDFTPATTWFDVATQSGWIETVAGQFGTFSNKQTLNNKFYSPYYTVQPGETIQLIYSYKFAGQGQDDGGGLINVGKPIGSINAGSFMFNDIQTIAIPETPISLSSCLPKSIKKKDFLTSIIKMFNLVVEPDRTNPKTLNIETRDYYYKTGKVKDWSNKIDLLDPIQDNILGDVLAKITTFKYKDDKDYYNTDYSSFTNESFGMYKYTTESEFVVSENILEMIFSPTPIDLIKGTDIVIPKIFTVNNNIEQTAACNIRILQKKYITGVTNWRLNGNMRTDYPYLGHYDDPTNPTIDINFGQVKALYYPNPVITTNNLFNTYWYKMVSEMSDRDSKIITCNLYLTPQDIVDFRFSDNIYLDFGQGGQYYKVNKINYDPAQISTSVVELVLTKNIFIPTPVQIPGVITRQYPTGVLSLTQAARNNTIPYQGPLVIGAGNYINGSSVIVGDSNNTQGRGCVINGDNNNSSGDLNTIFGSNNKVTGSNNYLVGNNMTITGDNITNVGGVITGYTTLLIAAGDVKNLHSVPVQILPAPGPGYFIEFVAAAATLVNTGTVSAYTGWIVLTLICGTATKPQKDNATILESAVLRTTLFDTTSGLTPTDTCVLENSPLMVTVDGGNPSTGNSDIKVYLEYRIRQV